MSPTFGGGGEGVDLGYSSSFACGGTHGEDSGSVHRSVLYSLLVGQFGDHGEGVRVWSGGNGGCGLQVAEW